MSIPKIIHYCWFGNNELSPLATHCIESWKKYCPEYEIVCWNESNFDVKANQFVKEAYESQSWAFVSDYVRLYALYQYGGIYMDADFELIKPIDELVTTEKAFTGYQGKSIPAAIIASEKNNSWIEKLLSYYKDRKFILDNKGKKNEVTNSRIITKITIENFDFKMNDSFIPSIELRIFNNSYFAPITKNLNIDKIIPKDKKSYYEIYDDTYGIHHFAGSWKKEDLLSKIRKKNVYLIKKYLGHRGYRWIKDRFMNFKNNRYEKKRGNEGDL